MQIYKHSIRYERIFHITKKKFYGNNSYKAIICSMASQTQRNGIKSKLTGNIVWDWRDAAFGAAIASFAAVLILTGSIENGLHLLLGFIPAAMSGLTPLRKNRKLVLIVGILFGVS